MLICRTESAETGCSGDGVPTSSGPRCTKSSMSDAATPVRPSRSVPSKSDTAHAAPYAPSACRSAGVIAAARPVRSTTVRPASADRRSSEASASVSHTTGEADSTTIAEPTTSSMRGCLTIRVLLGSGLELLDGTHGGDTCPSGTQPHSGDSGGAIRARETAYGARSAGFQARIR